MKRELFIVLITTLFLLSTVLVGCEGGIAQEEYDRVVAELEDEQAKVAEVQAEITEAQAEITKAQNQINDLQLEKENIATELEATQAEVDELEEQVSGLMEEIGEYELVGATNAETAENIVRYYHETHEYSANDLFICSDMASEVWNMLQAQGIDAVVAVGNTDTAIEDILLSNHAWVLAEVAPEEYLALETTGGFVVLESENPLYYRGWSFDSPADIKSYHQLVREYNVRVSIHNELVAEDGEVVEEHNQETNPQRAGELEAVHDMLVELIKAQETELSKIEFQINGLSTKCGT